MRDRSRWQWVALAATVLLVPIGCGSEQPTPAASPTVTGPAAGGGTTTEPPDGPTRAATVQPGAEVTDEPTAAPGRTDDASAPEDTTDEVPPHAGGPPEGADDPDVYAGEEGGFQASSGPVTDDERIARPFTCDGQSQFPPFQFVGVPEGAQAIAIVMFDRDADALHWQVTNIPAATEKFESGRLPDGAVEGENRSGEVGYAPPCPPEGETHEYVFTVFALSTSMDPVAPTSVADVLAAYEANALEKVELVGRYR